MAHADRGDKYTYNATGITFDPLSVNPMQWSNTLKQFVGFCRLIV